MSARDKDEAKNNYIEFLTLIRKLGINVHIYQDILKTYNEGYRKVPEIIQKGFFVEKGAAPIKLQLKQAGFSKKATRIGWTYTGKAS
ncbi:hypothetical protein L4D76_23940 [Photobacterium sagamiensis]|uniref:hypothetical protein n=1 Tax=Photobacterium sagamiensis TaxID=2910241 RepID=UPI003D0F9595